MDGRSRIQRSKICQNKENNERDKKQAAPWKNCGNIVQIFLSQVCQANDSHIH